MSSEEGEDYPGREAFKKSKYNSAIAQLYRIDYLWQEAHRHARHFQYVSWNEDLERIWLELSPDSDSDDLKNIRNINYKLQQIGIFGLSENVRNKNLKLFNKLILMQKNLLTEKEMFLRKLQNKQGKGAAYEDPMEEYMD